MARWNAEHLPSACDDIPPAMSASWAAASLGEGRLAECIRVWSRRASIPGVRQIGSIPTSGTWPFDIRTGT